MEAFNLRRMSDVLSEERQQHVMALGTTRLVAAAYRQGNGHEARSRRPLSADRGSCLASAGWVGVGIHGKSGQRGKHRVCARIQPAACVVGQFRSIARVQQYFM